MLPFKDISYAQGLWNMDTDNDQIVAMKASGFYTGAHTPYLDAQLTRNYADAIRLGKVPILYHFAGGADAATEAAYFIAAIHPLAEGDVYALDWEIDVDDPVGWVLTFVTAVYTATGTWPLVYMDISRLNAYDWSAVLANCPLWCAAPSYGWSDTLPVKYTVSAQQGPIVNGVDTDMWFGTLDGLKACGYHVPNEPTPTPTPAPMPPTPPAPSPAPVPIPAPTPEPLPTPAPTPTPTPNPGPRELWVVQFFNWLKRLLGIN